MATMKKASGQAELALSYAPDFQLDEETKERLTGILYTHQLVEEPENPIIVCAWTFSDERGQQMDVALYLNGGDSEEGGFLFYRRMADPSGCGVQEVVSVPGSWRQAKLRKFCGWQGHSEWQRLYEQATKAAQHVLKDTSAWISLPKRESQQE